jgi:hypothetical protein
MSRKAAAARSRNSAFGIAPSSDGGTPPSVVAAAAARAGAPSAISALTFAADHVGTPQLAPLGEGMVDPVKPPAETVPTDVEPPPPPPDAHVEPPRLAAVLRGSPADLRGPRRTAVAAAAAALPRVEAPKLAAEQARTRGPGSLRLELFDLPTRTDGGTVKPSDAGPPTSRAGGLTEVRSGRRAAPDAAASIEQLESSLRGGGAIALTAGDVHVLTMPRSEFDTGPARPRIDVSGSDQPVRAVALDRGGAVLAEQTADRFALELPRGTHTIGLVGIGRPDLRVDAPPAGLAGWHAGTSIAQVAGDTFLGPHCVIRTTSPATLRAGAAATCAIVRAADAVQGRGVVASEFRGAVRTVVVALETAAGIDELLTGVVLGLGGAMRTRGAGDRPVPPVGVASGPRAYVMFDVTADGGGAPVAVTAASDERWALAGTFAAAVTPAELRPRLEQRGLDGLLGGLVSTPQGRSEIRYVAPAGGPVR